MTCAALNGLKRLLLAVTTHDEIVKADSEAAEVEGHPRANFASLHNLGNELWLIPHQANMSASQGHARALIK